MLYYKFPIKRTVRICLKTFDNDNKKLLRLILINYVIIAEVLNLIYQYHEVDDLLFADALVIAERINVMISNIYYVVTK